MPKKDRARRVSNQPAQDSITGNGHDPEFTAEDLEYNEQEFLNPAHDDHGNTVQMGVRFSPQVQRALEIIRDTKGKFPYKTTSDIIRHAIVRHIFWLHRIEPSLPRQFYGMLQAVLEVVRDHEMGVATRDTFVKMDEIIQRFIGMGDTQEAMRVMSVCRGQVDKSRDSSWKRSWMKEFTAKYGTYLQPQVQPTASPDGGDGDDGGKPGDPTFEL